MRNMLLPLLVTGLLLCLGRCEAAAQQQSVSEHRYRFALGSEMSTYSEKLLLESLQGFDPNMRVAIDRTEHVMKVLAYVPLDQQAVVSIAAHYGVTLVPRRMVTEHDGTYSSQD